MFTVRFVSKRGTAFSHEPVLINRLYKHKSLAELLAEAQITGIPPIPTRNGVYTGESVITRDIFDRIDVTDKIALDLARNEAELKRINEEHDKEEQKKIYAEMKEQWRKEYEESRNNKSPVSTV